MGQKRPSRPRNPISLKSAIAVDPFRANTGSRADFGLRSPAYIAACLNGAAQGRNFAATDALTNLRSKVYQGGGSLRTEWRLRIR
jgi:hypothetical protein